jgi:hypothetical protein
MIMRGIRENNSQHREGLDPDFARLVVLSEKLAEECFQLPSKEIIRAFFLRAWQIRDEVSSKCKCR